MLYIWHTIKDATKRRHNSTATNIVRIAEATAMHTLLRIHPEIKAIQNERAPELIELMFHNRDMMIKKIGILLQNNVPAIRN